MRHLIIGLLLIGCTTVPPPPDYDPACFDHTLPVGVPYPTPTDPLDELFDRPHLDGYPRTGDGPSTVVTVRRVGPYSEPEAQLSLIKASNGEIRAELYVPTPCSVSDQLYNLYVQDPQSTEPERIGRVQVMRISVSDRDLPELREIYRNFLGLRLRTRLFEGLVLDQRSYKLWVETPLESLELSTLQPDRAFAVWAEQAIGKVARHADRSLTSR